MKKVLSKVLTSVCTVSLSTAIASAGIAAGPIFNPANGHDYYLLTPNTWTASEAEAVRLGGHLVTINDAAENQWVFDTFNRSGQYGLWIGLNDSATEGQFVWSSGKPVSFTDWAGGQPDNFVGQEDYGMLFVEESGQPSGRSRKWNDFRDWAREENVSGGVLQGVVEVAPQIQPISYMDDFEAPTLNPFWTIFQGSGVLALSANQVHSGAQSVCLTTTNRGVSMEVQLNHDFARPVYGRVSLWVYDSGADQPSGNYHRFYLRLPGSSQYEIIISTADFDGGPNNGGNYEFNTPGPSGPISHNSGIDRTNGWHHFEITSIPTLLEYRIDGQVVHSSPGGYQFKGITFSLGAPAFRPGLTSYVDDFQFVEAASAPRVTIQVGEVDVCWDSSTNVMYQIQYRSNLTTNLWRDLGVPIPGTGARQCITDSVRGQSQRFYRVMLAQ